MKERPCFFSRGDNNSLYPTCLYNHSFAQACILHGNHSFSGEQCGPWTSCLATLYEKLLIWPKFISTEICLSDSLTHEIFTLNFKGLFVLMCLSGQTVLGMCGRSREWTKATRSSDFSGSSSVFCPILLSLCLCLL